MNFWRLECFVALAEELHFGRAARKLHISQPALSQQVKQLENDLGVSLVNREKEITLTSAGQTLHLEGAKLLRAAADMVEAVKASSNVIDGELSIHYGRSLPADIGVKAVLRFREAHPQVEILSQTMWTSWNLDALRDGITDVAFVRLPVLNEPELTTLQLGSSEQYLAMLPANPLAAHSTVERSAIGGATLVPWIREDAPGAWDEVFGALEREGVVFAPAEPDMQRRLAVAEYLDAVTLVNDFTLHELPGSLVARPIHPPLMSEFGIAWRRGSRSLLVNRFVETARRVAQQPDLSIS